MGHSEIYIDADRYAFAVAHIGKVLRRHVNGDADMRHMATHAALRGLVDMGEPSLEATATGRRIVPQHYRELVDALAALEPWAGHVVLDDDQVKIALGEVGNIWPASIEADVDAERFRELRLAMLADGRRISREIFEGTKALALRGSDVGREHIQACADDVERQLREAARTLSH